MGHKVTRLLVLPFVLMLYLTTVSTAEAARHRKCKRDPIQLTEDQIYSLQCNQTNIRKLENLPLSYLSRMPPIVTLTRQQERRIDAQYGHMFTTIDEMPSLPSRYKRAGQESQEDYARACEVEQSYNPIHLAFNMAGKMVQNIQLPILGKYQMILHERCGGTHCYGVKKSRCGDIGRAHNAYVIDLITEKLKMEMIQVSCCVCMVSLTNDSP